MIYTVTLNPSLDYLVNVKDFKMGHTNRTDFEQMLPGGKGINVSTVLKNLGQETTAIGFLAGFTGKEIERKVKTRGITTEFLYLETGTSRINVKMLFCEGTEINAWGPSIPEEKIEELKEKLKKIKKEDILVIGGGIPQGIRKTIYHELLEVVNNKGIHIVVDAEKELLSNALEYHPFLIKPNKDELEAIFNTRIETTEKIIECAKELQRKGAINVLVSLGAKGAVLISENGSTYCMDAPHGNVSNTVGAGDSMIAGFLTGWMQKKDYTYAFKMSVAAGSATAFSTNLATSEEIKQVYQRLKACDFTSMK